MRREETYHLLHADAWLRRLASAPPPASDRLAGSLRTLWPDAQQVFAPAPGEDELVRQGLLPETMRELHRAWEAEVRPIIEPIAGELPSAEPEPAGRLRRTADFEWLHGEFTRVAGSEQGATW
jgi:1,2-phenylacetyl-CoA epoxidase catalytic subunit